MSESTPHQPESLSELSDGVLANKIASVLVGGGDDFGIVAKSIKMLLEAAEGANPEATPYIDELYNRIGSGLSYEEPEEVEG